jgi:hypothetical protein
MPLLGNMVCPWLASLSTGWAYVTGMGQTTASVPWFTPTASVTWGTPSSGEEGGTVAASNQPVLSISSALTDTGSFQLLGVYLLSGSLAANLNLSSTSGADFASANQGASYYFDPASTFTQPGTFTITAMSLGVDYVE